MTQRSMRADARRSYDRIVEAADGVIARDGADASLEQIARTAGVGSATLHRHFPSRWDLLDAVFTERVHGLRDEAQRLAEAHPAGVALVSWLRTLTRESARNHGMAISMFAERPAGSEADGDCHDIVRGAGEMLLRNAVAEGAVRPDASLDDLLALISAIATSTDGSPAAAEASQSLVDLVLEGIFPRGTAAPTA
jgi:AcrR family transcriptional regulator